MAEVTDIQEHEWINYDNKVCCKNCGNIKRADGNNKPCRGKVYVKTR